MASPIGHVLVGTALASVVARATGTPTTPFFWLGVVVSSGIPDLDLLLGAFGRSGPQYHRNGSHSLLVLGGLTAAGIAINSVFFGSDSLGLIACWSVALLSHPLLDLWTTGPDLGKRGYGIGLLWPLSGQRFYVNRPIVKTPELEKCKDVRQLAVAIRPEVVVLGPPAVVILVLSRIA